MDNNQIKKKKSYFNLHNDENVLVILSIKELLNVSSDWINVKNSNKGAKISVYGLTRNMNEHTDRKWSRKRKQYPC